MNVYLPRRCWVVDWCLGCGMTTYKVVEAHYDCTTGKLIKIYCERPHSKAIFNSDELKENVFFNEQDALKYLKRKETEVE